jgi:very-short-patch-repair endonuclease
LSTDNIASLQTVFKTAAQTVSGEKVSGSEGFNIDRAYASTKTAMSVGASATPNMSKVAQLGNITTSPNFYSPFLTATSFQIPNARKEVYLWANWWRNNEPKIAAGINFYTNYPFSGWKLECSSSYVKDYFEKLIQKLNFQKWLPEISKVYHLLGDVFVLASIECPHCHGSNWDTKKNQECEHEGATWKSLSILNPDSVMKLPGMIDQEGQYVYRPSAEEIRIVQEKQPREFYDQIPDSVKKMILRGEPIKLNPLSIKHFKHGSNPWEDYGTPMIRPLFPTLAYKDKLRQSQWLVAERHILPIKIVKVGNDQRPASQEDLDNVQEELAAIANDPNLTLVTHHAFDFEYYGASGKVLQLTNEYELIDQEILDGLMLNKALLNGEGPTYGNAQVGLLAMAQRLETFRREVAHWIEEQLFKQVSIWNGFVVEGERGQDEIIYPKIKFDDLQLRDDTGKLQMLVTANSNGVISNMTLIESFGLDPDQEIERLRFEQGSSFVNNPNIANTDMLTGFSSGPVTGAGFTGGPPTPDAGMGMGAPDMGMGAPPMGAPAPPPPAPAPPTPTASSIENYRLASSVINDIYNEKLNSHNKNTNNRLASIRFKSAAHEGFLKSITPVTGRGLLGALPSQYDGFGNKLKVADFGGEYSFPVNDAANYMFYSWQNSEDANIRSTFAKKKLNRPQAKMFTSLEKSLYNLLLSMNLPFSIYGQYLAGPTMDYQLDAAIPEIGLAIEADGEIWHNNPEKIARDKRRDIELSANGWTVLRFTDKELKEYSQDVINVISQAIRKKMGNSNTGDEVI